MYFDRQCVLKITVLTAIFIVVRLSRRQQLEIAEKITFYMNLMIYFDEMVGWLVCCV